MHSKAKIETDEIFDGVYFFVRCEYLYTEKDIRISVAIIEVSPLQRIKLENILRIFYFTVKIKTDRVFDRYVIDSKKRYCLLSFYCTVMEWRRK